MYHKQIDSFRFFAVFLVLVSHWLHYLPHIEQLRFGAFGVEFFFCISGFLISGQLYAYKEKVEEKVVSKARAIWVFYIRRILRIFPLYYLIVILTALLNKGEIREAFIWNIGYASNFYFIKTQEWTSTFSHFWSLSVEEHFYLIWPFFLILVKRKYFPLLFILLSAFSIWFRYDVFAEAHDYFKVYVHTFSAFDLFMTGAALAYFHRYYYQSFLKLFSNRAVRYLVLIAFLALYYVWIFKVDWALFNWIYARFFYSIIYCFLIGFLVVGFKGPMAKVFENKYLIHAGSLSYGIYLLHNFVPGILLGIKKLEWHYSIEFVIYLATTLIISEILYRFFETPIRNLNRYFVIDKTSK